MSMDEHGMRETAYVMQKRWVANVLYNIHHHLARELLLHIPK